MVINCKKNGSNFLDICGGKERRYRSSSFKEDSEGTAHKPTVQLSDLPTPKEDFPGYGSHFPWILRGIPGYDYMVMATLLCCIN